MLKVHNMQYVDRKEDNVIILSEKKFKTWFERERRVKSK